MQLARVLRTALAVGYDLFLKLNPRKVAAHAVICDDRGRVLALKSRYAEAWLLPGGGLKPGEHLDEGVRRECREELGAEVTVEALTGLYYVERSAAYVGVFRCRLEGRPIRLSHEHEAFAWVEPERLPPAERAMAEDALRFAGTTVVARLPGARPAAGPLS